MLLSIGEAANALGVCPTTLRRWERDRKISAAKRTPGQHRRFDLKQLMEELGFELPISHEKINIGYARVSSHGQAEDLVRQSEALESHLKMQAKPYEMIQDLGSGMSFRKRGLKKLLRMIVNGHIASITVTHKDRLVRFGFELIAYICEQMDVKIIVLNQEMSLDDSIQLSQDVLEIITVFSARLYGKRSHSNSKRHGAQGTQAA